MADAPHIFTLTGNLLAERTLEFADWAPGKTQRATRESFQVGGKGINVAKMLARLGAPHTALCFAGGAPGEECTAWLKERGFSFHAFATNRPTRSGTVVRDGNRAETTFLGPDVPPSASAVAACAEFLDAQPAGEILALCGSFPGWNDAAFDPLRAACERWIERGTLVADTYGPPLGWVASRRVALVKINAAELRTLRADEQDVASALGRAQIASPVERWVITDGAADVWFCDRQTAPARLSPPSVAEISATGSGDVLFACVIDALFRKRQTLAKSVLDALPFAAANAAHPGIAEFLLPG
jgi:fructose-1-phosphate kinase PfkB-like protein